MSTTSLRPLPKLSRTSPLRNQSGLLVQTLGARMKIALAIVFGFGLSSNCSAKDFVRQAKPGEPTQMWVYLSWHPEDCSPNIGVVKLIRKPQHGTLKTSQVDSRIIIPRRNPEKNAHCIGKSAPGFRVDYTSEPNYKGPDNFQIR